MRSSRTTDVALLASLASLVLIAGCGSSGGSGGSGSTSSASTAASSPPASAPPTTIPRTTAPAPAASPAAAASPAPAAPALAGVQSYAYQLQNIDIPTLAASRFDLFVIDPTGNGSDATRWSAAQVASLQSGPKGPRAALAYLSIGEAETYRTYWQPSWAPGNPTWLGPEDPQWPGNYKVQYWDPTWQALIMSEVDKILAQGFDGVYLDIIDAYEFWGPGGPGGLNRATAEQEMVDFVRAIADHARTVMGKAGFLVFPQNGSGLSSHPEYVAAVSGIGNEDVWYNNDTPNAAADVQQRLSELAPFLAAGKLVLVIDYVRVQADIDDFYAKAQAQGFVPYASDRGLDQLTVNPGHAP